MTEPFDDVYMVGISPRKPGICAHGGRLTHLSDVDTSDGVVSVEHPQQSRRGSCGGLWLGQEPTSCDPEDELPDVPLNQEVLLAYLGISQD